MSMYMSDVFAHQVGVVETNKNTHYRADRYHVSVVTTIHNTQPNFSADCSQTEYAKYYRTAMTYSDRIQPNSYTNEE